MREALRSEGSALRIALTSFACSCAFSGGEVGGIAGSDELFSEAILQLFDLLSS